MFGVAEQHSLFGDAEVGFDRDFTSLERVDLGLGAWIDYVPTWLTGDDLLFSRLTETAQWTQPVVKMYDKEVITPRLIARIDPSSDPIIPEIVDALAGRYGMRLDQVSAGWYRDGGDSVAYHGDRIARERESATVATVSLGSPRRFLIRPKGGGPSRNFSLGHGDLVVMGGTCQRTFEHTIPKTKSADPRIALMFRHTYD